MLAVLARANCLARASSVIEALAARRAVSMALARSGMVLGRGILDAAAAGFFVFDLGSLNFFVRAVV
jgi:hypothetical protein